MRKYKGKSAISDNSRQYAYTSNDVQCRIDDNVRVYVLEDGEYKAYGIDKLKEKNYAVMTGYYDQDSAYGGKIRVIIAY